MDELPNMVSPEDLANHLRVTKRTIFLWISEGRLPAPQRLTERTLRWRREDLTDGPKPKGTFTPPPKGEFHGTQGRKPKSKASRSPKKRSRK